MSRTLLRIPLLLAGAILAAAPAAPAADEGVTFVPTMKAAFEKAKVNGAPILVWAVGDDDSAEKADQQVFLEPTVRKAMRGYLVLFANPVDGHGSENGTVDGKPGKVCKLTKAFPCDSHKVAYNELRNSYADVMNDKAGASRFPNHFVLDAARKVVGSIVNGSLAGGFDAVQPPTMVKGLQSLLLKAGGPGLTDEQVDAAKKKVMAARTTLEGGRAAEAAQILAPVAAIAKPIEVVAEAKDLLKRVDRAAAEPLGKAQADLKAGKVIDAIAGFDRVVKDFPGTESAAAAQKARDQFLASPEGKKALVDVKRQGEGREKLKKALAVLEAGSRDAEALRLLDDIARAYKGLPVGEEAAAKAEAIRGDPERMKAIAADKANRDAAGLLSQAQGFLAAGKKDEARERLQKILDSYPGTPAAEEAKRLLEANR